MNIQSISKKIYTNKTVLNTLEKISEHGTSFSAGMSLALATTVRPLSISLAPNVEKENKQYAISNSISSGIIKFGIVEAIALPIENLITKIEANPQKFLNKSTAEDLANNKSAYKFIFQTLKLAPGIITAIPKSMLTVALIPIIMDKVFHLKPQQQKNKIENKDISQKSNKDLNFTGNIGTKGIAKIVENTKVQKFAKKYESMQEDIAKHITAFTDILLTGAAVYQTDKNPNIKQDRKKPLIYNNIISTGITLLIGYGLDKVAKILTGGMMNNFIEANKQNPKLDKYIAGINIIRPALIFAGVYYLIIPFVSTYLAEKLDKYASQKEQKV